MPIRFAKPKRHESRKKRKAVYMRVKTLMRLYPECAYNGDFYCNHVYDPDRLWQRVDFRFFHSTKKICFSVVMGLAHYEAYDAIEECAHVLAKFPEFSGPFFVPGTMTMNKGTPLYQQEYKEATERKKKIQYELSSQPVYVVPKVKVLHYGLPVIRLYVTVNKPHIDEHVIRDFIKFFRALGEPTKPGWEWEGEKVAVITRQFFKNPEDS